MADSKTQAACFAAYALSVDENFVNPLGFHNPRPAFSWKLPVTSLQAQSAYRIIVAETAPPQLAQTLLWDSGRVESAQSVQVAYAGKPLSSAQQVYWQVKVWDENGGEHQWSESAWLELGLLANHDWQGQWIGLKPAAAAAPPEPPVAPAEKHEFIPTYLRREFVAGADVAQARLYVTAKGLFEVWLNGTKVGRDHFTPGWTSYTNRIETLTYDVTGMVRGGEANAVGAVLGDGWFAGRIGWRHDRSLYGSNPMLLLQLHLTYTDGSSETIVSDSTWQASANGPIRASSLYDGEVYDARLEMPGWNCSGYAAAGWQAASSEPVAPTVALEPKRHAPVRPGERELPAISVQQPQPERFVFDFGQNLVGWPRLTMPVEAGQVLTLRVAEMLEADGTLYTANYRSAKSSDTYLAATTGVIDWHPTFTFHGFRYVELSGLTAGAVPQPDWISAIVLHSDLVRSGHFESSHTKLNQLYSNIVWGQRGNFLDVPTDCPQRDERLGWTGDAQVFCPIAMFNYDCHAFFASWLQSMRDDQMPDGRIPHVIPDVLRDAGSPGWQDAAIIIPWQIYVRTADCRILADNYAMMQRLLAWYGAQAVDGRIAQIGGFGDWLQPYSQSCNGDTPLPLLGQAFYANNARILAEIAAVLGYQADAEQYQREADVAKAAFREHYFTVDGKLQNAPETQTAYLLALAFELLPGELRAAAAANLVQLVHAAGVHLQTGFLGTPFLTDVLERAGYAELALAVLFKETYPSWFFTINQGATTMWERWNSYSHADGFGDAGMNSFNHYAYGAVGQWMVERLAGLEPDPKHPGYKHFIVRPLPGGPLTAAHAQLETPYGRAASSWELDAHQAILTVSVPANTSATIIFPADAPPRHLGPGKHTLQIARPTPVPSS